MVGIFGAAVRRCVLDLSFRHCLLDLPVFGTGEAPARSSGNFHAAAGLASGCDGAAGCVQLCPRQCSCGDRGSALCVEWEVWRSSRTSRSMRSTRVRLCGGCGRRWREPAGLQLMSSVTPGRKCGGAYCGRLVYATSRMQRQGVVILGIASMTGTTAMLLRWCVPCRRVSLFHTLADSVHVC